MIRRIILLGIFSILTFHAAFISVVLVSVDLATPALAAEHKKSETKKDKQPTFSGIFYGYLLDVREDGSAITVKPIKPMTKRRRFYLDKKTEVRVDGKRKPRSDLYYGDKVAVRYLGKGPILLADAVFVVSGEFDPKDYVAKKAAKVVAKPAAAPAAEHKPAGH